MPHPSEHELTSHSVIRNTMLGVLAILFWSTNVAFSRSLAERLGFLTAGAAMFILGGLISIIFQMLQERRFNILRHSSARYLGWCGLIFVANTVSLEAAIGLSTSRSQVIIVALINYLWPALSLFFSVFILQRKPRPWLVPGMLLALSGMALATTGGDIASLQGSLEQPRVLVVYGLAAIAAVTWGLYSNLSRKWAGSQDSGSVPLFLLASGLLMGLMRLFVPERSTFSLAGMAELAYMVIFPTILAYIFWDAAMRKGRMVTVIALSYFIPLFATIISTLKLGVRPSAFIWIAALLIILGAWVCKMALPEK